MKLAVFPGSFDPITYGHLNVIEKAAKVFDKVIVAVADHPKKSYLLSMTTRQDLILQCPLPSNVFVDVIHGWVVDYVERQNADYIVRGIRDPDDVFYELKMADINKSVGNGIETIFFHTDNNLRFVSSSLVKEMAESRKILTEYVPPHVEHALREKICGCH